MQEYIVIKDIFKNSPELLANRQKLKGVLNDNFPKNKLIVNMVLIAYDEGLFEKIQNSDDVNEFVFQQISTQLISNYGITNETALRIVSLLAIVCEKQITFSIEDSVKVEKQNSQIDEVERPHVTYPVSPSSDFLFASNGSEIRINKYIGKGGNVVIPDTINGLPVTQIAAMSFTNSKYAKKITALCLPRNLKKIGYNAFNYLENLTGVLILPATLETIESHAFQSSGITGIVIQSNCNIELNALANLDELEFVYIKRGCSPKIDDVVFAYSDKLKDVVIPKETTTIDDSFKGCTQMVIYTPKGSFAEKHGMKHFISVDTENYELMAQHYESIYG